ncbi:hypothetical protein FOCC_FOCC017360 [Frankliniella occidentalis]|nr:hypothetical protein FOCC_FOCC017360 [Frankliniella occidentalis]
MRSGRGQPSAEALSDALLEAMRDGNKGQLEYIIGRVVDGRLREDSLAAAWRRARVQRLPLSEDMQQCAVDSMVALRYGSTTEWLSGALLEALQDNSVEGVEAVLRTVTNARLQKDSLEAAWRQAQDQGVFVSNKMKKLLKNLLNGYSELLSREQTLGWDALWGLVDRLLDEYLPRLLELLGRDGEEEDEVVELATLSALAIRELKGHFYRSYGEVPWEEVEYLLAMFVEARTVYTTLTFLVTQADKMRVHLEFFMEKVRVMKTTYKIRPDREAAVKEMKRAHGERAAVTAKAAVDQRLKTILEDFTLLRDWYSLDEVVKALEAAIEALRLPSQIWEEWGWLALRRGLFVAGEKMKNSWTSPNLSSRYVKLLELTAPEGILKLLCSWIRDVQEHSAAGTNAEALTMSDLDSEQRRKWLEEELGRVLHTVSAMLTEAETELLRKGMNLDNVPQTDRVANSLRNKSVTSDATLIYEEVIKILKAANQGKRDEKLHKLISELGDLQPRENVIIAIQCNYNKSPHLSPLTALTAKVYSAVLLHCPQDVPRIRQLLDWKSVEGLSNFQAKLNESSCIGGGSGEASRHAIERALSALEAIERDSNHVRPVRHYAVEGGLQALASRWYKDDQAPPLLVAHEPALFGRQLRNHLNHKDLAMTVFFPTVEECRSLWGLLLSSRSLVADRRGVAHRVQEPAAAAAVNAEVLRLARLKDEMFRGARRGGLAEVQRAAGLGVDLSSRDCRGRTLLHAAAEAGQARLVDWLLKTEALDPLAQDREGRSALHCAATAENSNLTPLHLAARGGHEAAVHVLLQAGARYESVGDQATPLTAAAQVGSTPVVSLLRDLPVLQQPSDEDFWLAAGLAGLLRHADVFSTLTAELKRRGAQLDCEAAQLCVSRVAVGGSTEVAKHLLEYWPDAVRLEFDTYYQRTALTLAAEHRYAALVRSLLRVGADPLQRDKDSGTALHAAAAGGSVEVIDALWDQTQAEQDAGRRAALLRLWEGREEKAPPLCHAAGGGHLEAVQRLVELGADKDVTPPDKPDETPLCSAAAAGRAEVVRWLQRRSAREGAALHMAAGMGHLAVVKLLVPASQLPKQQQRERLDRLQLVDSGGNAPLVSAVASGSLGVVKYLLVRELQLLEAHYSRTVKDRRCVTPRKVTVYSLYREGLSALQWSVCSDAPSSVFRELLRYMEDPRLMELGGTEVLAVRDMVRAALDLVEPVSLEWTSRYGRGNHVEEMKKVLNESLRRLQDSAAAQRLCTAGQPE